MKLGKSGRLVLCLTMLARLAGCCRCLLGSALPFQNFCQEGRAKRSDARFCLSMVCEYFPGLCQRFPGEAPGSRWQLICVRRAKVAGQAEPGRTEQILYHCSQIFLRLEILHGGLEGRLTSDADMDFLAVEPVEN